MTYGLVQCGLCRRPRVADLSNASSTCPYCGYEEMTSGMRVHFESDSQSAVRRAMAQATGAEGELPNGHELYLRKRRIERADPESTLAYRYEHASDLDERMSVLAEGLTEIKGEFTLEDVEEYESKRAERMLSAMLDRGYVHETRPGFYRA